MNYEAELLTASFEWAENNLKRLLFELEQAQLNFDVIREESIGKQIRMMLKRIEIEDKNVEKFVKKYGGEMNEKEISLFNTGKK